MYHWALLFKDTLSKFVNFSCIAKVTKWPEDTHGEMLTSSPFQTQVTITEFP